MGVDGKGVILRIVSGQAGCPDSWGLEGLVGGCGHCVLISVRMPGRGASVRLVGGVEWLWVVRVELGKAGWGMYDKIVVCSSRVRVYGVR